MKAYAYTRPHTHPCHLSLFPLDDKYVYVPFTHLSSFHSPCFMQVLCFSPSLSCHPTSSSLSLACIFCFLQRNPETLEQNKIVRILLTNACDTWATSGQNNIRAVFWNGCDYGYRKATGKRRPVGTVGLKQSTF